MLKYRLPSGIFMGLIILGSIFMDPSIGKILFLILGTFLAYFGVSEFLSMLEKLELKSYKKLTSLASALILILAVLEVEIIVIITIITLLVVSGWFMFVISDNKKDTISRVVISSSALIFLLFPLYFLVSIYLSDINGVPGRYYFFFLLLVTKIGDVGAYTFGTISAKIMPGGNHKILPTISPKKSWEGTIGGLITSIVASFIFCQNMPEMIPDGWGVIFPLLAGALLFIGGFVGDLTESALKRGTGVKDSGTIIPGMGGALDVIDSLVLNSPLFYIFLVLIVK